MKISIKKYQKHGPAAGLLCGWLAWLPLWPAHLTLLYLTEKYETKRRAISEKISGCRRERNENDMLHVKAYEEKKSENVMKWPM